MTFVAFVLAVAAVIAGSSTAGSSFDDSFV